MATLTVGSVNYDLRFWPHGVYTETQRVLGHIDRDAKTIDIDGSLSRERVSQVVAELVGREVRRSLRRPGRKPIGRAPRNVPIKLIPIIGRTPSGPGAVYWDVAPGSAVVAS